MVWAIAQILSSSIEYLSARLYNSSIVAGGSKDSEGKKEVDGPKIILKFWRTMLYDSTCWMACPNLFVKSQIDFFFLFENGLQGADVSLLLYRAEIL